MLSDYDQVLKKGFSLLYGGQICYGVHYLFLDVESEYDNEDTIQYTLHLLPGHG